MSAQRLGELIGVSGEQIANYERGHHRLAAARLYDISVALDLPINEFFSDLVAKEQHQSQIVELVDDTAGDKPDPLGQRSEAEVIARLGKLASEVSDPAVRASVRRILKGLPIFFRTNPDPGAVETETNDPRTGEGQPPGGES
jgi:transcriptional regulator with XRE-family HTH domain